MNPARDKYSNSFVSTKRLPAERASWTGEIVSDVRMIERSFGGNGEIGPRELSAVERPVRDVGDPAHRCD
jgi:hypothetical protein